MANLTSVPRSVYTTSAPASQRPSVSSASGLEQKQKLTRGQKALKVYRKIGEIIIGPTYQVNKSSYA